MITVNGVEKILEKPLSVTEYLETNKYVPVQVAIELNDKILARELYPTTILKEGDIMEIVSFMGGEKVGKVIGGLAHRADAVGRGKGRDRHQNAGGTFDQWNHFFLENEG